MAKQRQNVNLELQPQSRAQLEAIRDWNGMTQKQLIARLIEWFCDQDRVLQQLILGQIPQEIAPDVAKVILQRLADPEPTFTPPPAPTPQPELVEI